MRRKVVLQPPIQISAIYTQSDREAIEIGPGDTVEVFVEVYQNSATVSVDISFLTATDTPSAPYGIPTNVGFVNPTGAKVTVTSLATGTQQPFTVTHLGSLMKVGAAVPTGGTIAFSVTVYITSR